MREKKLKSYVVYRDGEYCSYDNSSGVVGIVKGEDKKSAMFAVEWHLIKNKCYEGFHMLIYLSGKRVYKLDKYNFSLYTLGNSPKEVFNKNGYLDLDKIVNYLEQKKQRKVIYEEV